MQMFVIVQSPRCQDGSFTLEPICGGCFFMDKGRIIRQMKPNFLYHLTKSNVHMNTWSQIMHRQIWFNIGPGFTNYPELSVPYFVNCPPQRVFVTSFNVGFASAAPSTNLEIWNKCTFFILVDLKWPDDDIEQLFGSFCVFSARTVCQVVSKDISRLFSKTLWSLENCMPSRMNHILIRTRRIV